MKHQVEPDQIAYQLSSGYFTISASSEGYDYSFFNAKYEQIDGGIYDDDTVSIYTAIQDIAMDNLTWLSPELEQYQTLPLVDFEALTEKTEAVELAQIAQFIADLPQTPPAEKHAILDQLESKSKGKIPTASPLEWER